MDEKIIFPGKDGEKYVSPDKRSGEVSTVYFTRDLSPEGIIKLFKRVSAPLTGSNIAIKLHTGEQNGPNFIPSAWVKKFMAEALPDATIIETNTYYEGDRYTTELHRETLKVNGWDFAPVDILDEDGVVALPVNGGKWFTEMHMGANITKYDSMLALTHFKGHTSGGFGGSNKNIGIGLADGRIGKKEIHTQVGSDNQWSIKKEEFMERMTESTKAALDYFENRVTFINVMRNMSVDCDCDGKSAAPVVTPNIGILASTDILAVDSACIDCVYALRNRDKAALVERIESRHGLRQLTYMKELSMGNDCYTLIDTDNDDAVITAADAVSGVLPFRG